MYNLITKSATVVSKQKNTHTLLVVTVYKVRLIHLVLPPSTHLYNLPNSARVKHL